MLVSVMHVAVTCKSPRGHMGAMTEKLTHAHMLTTTQAPWTCARRSLERTRCHTRGPPTPQRTTPWRLTSNGAPCPHRNSRAQPAAALRTAATQLPTTSKVATSEAQLPVAPTPRPLAAPRKYRYHSCAAPFSPSLPEPRNPLVHSCATGPFDAVIAAAATCRVPPPSSASSPPRTTPRRATCRASRLSRCVRRAPICVFVPQGTAPANRRRPPSSGWCSTRGTRTSWAS